MAPSRLPTVIKTKNPLGFAAPAGQKCLISDLLTTPQRARRMAVMTMVPMGVRREIHGLQNK
jgi:hypothetical protein